MLQCGEVWVPFGVEEEGGAEWTKVTCGGEAGGDSCVICRQNQTNKDKTVCAYTRRNR